MTAETLREADLSRRLCRTRACRARARGFRRVPARRRGVCSSGPLRFPAGRSGHVAGGVWCAVADGAHTPRLLRRCRAGKSGVRDGSAPRMSTRSCSMPPMATTLRAQASAPRKLRDWVVAHPQGCVLPTPLYGRSAELLAIVPGDRARTRSARMRCDAQIEGAAWLVGGDGRGAGRSGSRAAADWHTGDALPRAALLCHDGMGISGPSPAILAQARAPRPSDALHRTPAGATAPANGCSPTDTPHGFACRRTRPDRKHRAGGGQRAAHGPRPFLRRAALARLSAHICLDCAPILPPATRSSSDRRARAHPVCNDDGIARARPAPARQRRAARCRRTSGSSRPSANGRRRAINCRSIATCVVARRRARLRLLGSAGRLRRRRHDRAVRRRTGARPRSLLCFLLWPNKKPAACVADRRVACSSSLTFSSQTRAHHRPAGSLPPLSIDHVFHRLEHRWAQNIAHRLSAGQWLSTDAEGDGVLRGAGFILRGEFDQVFARGECRQRQFGFEEAVGAGLQRQVRHHRAGAVQQLGGDGRRRAAGTVALDANQQPLGAAEQTLTAGIATGSARSAWRSRAVLPR